MELLSFLNLQANPDPNSCLGVFGLSLYTTERDLREVFSKYGPLADVSIVYDQQSRRSRGFAFVYFENRDDANEVNELKFGYKTSPLTLAVVLTGNLLIYSLSGKGTSQWHGAGRS